jgi:hypothetical protein
MWKKSVRAVSTVIGATVGTVALGVIVAIGETGATGLAVSPERHVSRAKDKRPRVARRVTLRHPAVRKASPRRIELVGCRGCRMHPRCLPSPALR